MIARAIGVLALLLALAVLRDVEVDTRAVRPQTALSFAALLAVLVAGPRRRWLRALLVTPMLMLVEGHYVDHVALDYLRAVRGLRSLRAASQRRPSAFRGPDQSPPFGPLWQS
jgi:hypothetical protein